MCVVAISDLDIRGSLGAEAAVCSGIECAMLGALAREVTIAQAPGHVDPPVRWQPRQSDQQMRQCASPQHSCVGVGPCWGAGAGQASPSRRGGLVIHRDVTLPHVHRHIAAPRGLGAATPEPLHSQPLPLEPAVRAGVVGGPLVRPGPKHQGPATRDHLGPI